MSCWHSHEPRDDGELTRDYEAEEHALRVAAMRRLAAMSAAERAELDAQHAADMREWEAWRASGARCPSCGVPEWGGVLCARCW